MTKIADFIVQYLAENDSLELDGLGQFYRDHNGDVVESSNKELVRPIAFTQNKNAKTPDSFIDFAKAQSGKMKSLLISDVETFITTGKQLLNISKPFTIDGLGTITKDAHNIMTFEMGDYMPPKIDVTIERERKTKVKEKVINELNYESTYGKSIAKPKKIGKKALGTIAFVALLGSLGYLLYTFVFNAESKDKAVKKESSSPSSSNDGVQTDTSKKSINAIQPDSLGRVPFKIVVRTTDMESATKRAKDYQGYSMPNGYDTAYAEKDAASNKYNVVLVMKSRTADTGALLQKIQKEYAPKFQAYYKQ